MGGVLNVAAGCKRCVAVTRGSMLYAAACRATNSEATVAGDVAEATCFHWVHEKAMVAETCSSKPHEHEADGQPSSTANVVGVEVPDRLTVADLTTTLLASMALRTTLLVGWLAATAVWPTVRPTVS